METCRKCNGTDIKSSKNYPHGKKSKAIIVLTCRKCGSRDIEIKQERWKNQRRR